MATPKKPIAPDQDSPQEVEVRMVAAMKRALSTPPKPHKRAAQKASHGKTKPRARKG